MDGLVFDLNDCLVDRSDIPVAIRKATEYALEETGQPFLLPDGLFDRGWLIERGHNRSWLFDYLLMRNGIQHAERPEMVQRCLKYYSYLTYKSSKDVHPFDDTDILRWLDLPIALVTNTKEKTAKSILRRTALADYVDHGLIFANGDKAGALKQAAEALGSTTDKLVYVGDSSQDVCAGRFVGARTVAVERGYVPMGRILRARPNLIIKNLALLQPWLGARQP